MQRLIVRGNRDRMILSLLRKRPSVYVIESTCSFGILKTVSGWLAWGLNTIETGEDGYPEPVWYPTEDPHFLSRIKENLESQFSFTVELVDIPSGKG